LWILKWLSKDSFSQILDDYKVLPTTEHNLYVIRCSDWIIDLGPEGGDKGGEIVVTGTPEEVAEHPTSHTARYLKQVLEQHPPKPVAA
jgi:excinuclease ABC subunit A